MRALASTLYGSNSHSVLLDLIERHAPLMMRIGGGALSTQACETHDVRRLTAEDRERIVQKYLSAVDSKTDGAGRRAVMERIAEEYGIAYNTVVRITRPWRAIRATRPAK
jgi:hypothetical protein